MIYIWLFVVSALTFYAGMRFERDRGTGAWSRRFAVDAPKPAREPVAYLPTKKQLADWAKERRAIPTTRDTTVRRLVFGERVRIDITRRN